MSAMAPVVGIPVKPFGVAKQRLHPRIDAATRSALGRRIAARTARVAAAAGAAVVIVTGDPGVAQWAADQGLVAIDEGGPGRGLNGAVASLCDHALSRQRPWLALHADLPLLTTGEVTQLLKPLAAGREVIAPSHDGGSSAVGSRRSIEFSYGPGSYHRHLRRMPTATVVTRPGLAFDLDTVADLDHVVRHRAGRWIGELIAAIDSRP